MSLIDRILAEPEFVAQPPVLVDVGAAGGVPRAWRRIARHCVAVAFEPDAREAAPLTVEQGAFRQWVFVPALVVAEPPVGGRVALHLTRSPQCSSTLRPRTDALRRWAFAPFFEVVERREFPATTLADALQAKGLSGPDWLKCDTQGLDLRIFKSLPSALRERVLVTEFEPGIIDAYEDEDTLPQVLAAMREEPFWLSAFTIEQTARAPTEGLASAWYRRLTPGAPGWGNLQYLRDVAARAPALDRRAHLLLWVFSTLGGQPAFAAEVAASGQRRFGGALFAAMTATSERQTRCAMLWRLPAWVLKRLGFRG